MASSRTEVALTVAFHSTSAIAYTLCQKWSLRKFKGPVTVLFIQIVASIVILLASSAVFGRPQVAIRNRWQTWRMVMPLAAARFVGVLSKTICLANVDATFYQNARGLLLPFTALLSLFFLDKTCFSTSTIIAMAVVCFGFFVGVSSDLAAAMSSQLGIILGVWSSFTTAVETVVVKRFTSGETKDLSMFQMLFMSNAMCLALYIPLLWMTGEAEALLVDPRMSDFLHASLITAVVAFALSVAAWMQIKVTGPVTHTIVTAARGVLQTLLASFFLSEPMTRSRWTSTVLILAGTAMYTWSKEKERQAKEQQVLDEKSTEQAVPLLGVETKA